MEKLKDTLNDLSLTADEVNKLSEAFKKEEFRKLFREYAEELQDPENKRKYEEELTAMENERGMDIEFINPIPGHVLKTIQNSEKKVFINICQSDKIEKPNVNKTTQDNIRGATWSIPHSFSSPREDFDKKRESCLIYDVVFNVNAYQLSTKNVRFRKMLHETALEGIEKMFKVSLDKLNFKILKMKMKGIPVATVIRKKRADFDEKQGIVENQKNDPLSFPYPNIQETTVTEYNVNEKPKVDEFIKPVYKIKFSNNFDILNYVGENVHQISRPTKMIIDIKLPLVSSANSVDLDIDRKHLKLSTVKPVKYLLELNLTYPVLVDLGTAKFEKSTKTLKLDLPIEPVQEEILKVEPEIAPTDPSSLIEECPSKNDSDNDDNHTEEIQITAEQMTSPIVMEIENQVDRIIPDVELKFRKNKTHCFLLCEIRNVDKCSCKTQYESISNDKHQATITFSNCGQGGWKNLYKIPLLLSIPQDINSISDYVECLISEENIIIQIPLQIDSQHVEIISFNDHIFSCKPQNPITDVKNFENFNETTADVEENSTFNVRYGMIDKDVLKIVCVSLDCTEDLEQYFPPIESVPEPLESVISDETSEASDLENFEIVEDIQEQVEQLSVDTSTVTEILSDNKTDSKSHETIPSIIPSEYFETRRNPEHRTKCIVELSSSLLFDLE